MSKRRITLSYADALKLGAGDVLIVRGIARLIISGPRDNPPRRKPECHDRNPAIYFTFPIHRRSWTGRAYTLYLWNDLKWFARIPERPLPASTFAAVEREWLESQGFNVNAEIKREVAQERRLAKVFERPVDKGVALVMACLRKSNPK